MKLKFSATGSNSMVTGMCKQSIQRSLEAWSSSHNCDVFITETQTAVLVEFDQPSDFTLFMLTWDTKNLPHRRYKLIP